MNSCMSGFARLSHGRAGVRAVARGSEGGGLDIPRLVGSRIAVVGVPCSGKSTLIEKLFPERTRILDVRNYRGGAGGRADYLSDLASVMEIGDDLRVETPSLLTIVETVPFYEPFLAPFDIKLQLFPSDAVLARNRERRHGDATLPGGSNRCELTTYIVLGNPQCGKSELAERIVHVAHPEGRKLYVYTLPSTLPNIVRIHRHRRMRRDARWETLAWDKLERARGCGYSVMLVDGATKVLTSDPSATRKFFGLARNVAEVLILVLKGDPNGLVEDPVVATCYQILRELYPRYFNAPGPESFGGNAAGMQCAVGAGDSSVV